MIVQRLGGSTRNFVSRAPSRPNSAKTWLMALSAGREVLAVEVDGGFGADVLFGRALDELRCRPLRVRGLSVLNSWSSRPLPGSRVVGSVAPSGSAGLLLGPGESMM